MFMMMMHVYVAMSVVSTSFVDMDHVNLELETQRVLRSCHACTVTTFMKQGRDATSWPG